MVSQHCPRGTVWVPFLGEVTEPQGGRSAGGFPRTVGRRALQELPGRPP